ncbi:MAG: hypothetical protein JXN61_05240 [Sedimentisphaerales bacterium]|nr:hypothetical protein [Sedimentisphaerales bacterium]
MTNETFLYVSYFSAFILGLALAGVTLAVLLRPHREIIASDKTGKLGSLIRRVFSFWVFVAVQRPSGLLYYLPCFAKSEKPLEQAKLIFRPQDPTVFPFLDHCTYPCL